MEAISSLDMCDEWASDSEHEEEVRSFFTHLLQNHMPNKQHVEQPIVASKSTTKLPELTVNKLPPSTAIKTTTKPAVKHASTNTDNHDEINQNRPKLATKTDIAATQKQMAANQPPIIYIPPQPPQHDEDMFGQEIRCGTNFDKISAIPVKVSGDNVPVPIADFASAGLADHLLQNISKSGYKLPTPIQRHGIAAVLAARDVMACAQTGSGKTAAYLLGILHRLLTDKAPVDIGDLEGAAVRPLAVVVTPTRELAVQIFNEARKFAHGTYLRSCVLYGGTSVRYQLEQLKVSVGSWWQLACGSW